MEKKIRVLGPSGKRASSKKCKFFHQDVFFFFFFPVGQNSTFLSQIQNQLCVSLKMTFQMLFLFSYLFVVIRYFSVEKKHQETNYSVTVPPYKEAGKCSIWIWCAQAPRLRHTDLQGPSTPPKPLVTRRGEYSILDLAPFYQPLEIQGQTDSIVHSLIFFAVGKIRKFILSYFRPFWALECSGDQDRLVVDTARGSSGLLMS